MVSKNKKGLIPKDFRDVLSVIGILSFLAIFFKYGLGMDFLSGNLDALFFIVGGTGLMFIGKVFNVPEWFKDGIQKNEVSQFFTLLIGMTGIVIGVLMLVGISIPTKMLGVGAFIALMSAIYILIDYIQKNTK